MKIGEIGEQLVARWLETQGWSILHRRWHCRWGEIDLIAQDKPGNLLAFVEVKTRSRGNWDANGLLAITRHKQARLCRTAELFLSEYPDFGDRLCRFDVALVSYQRHQLLSKERSRDNFSNQGIKIGEPITWKGYHFTLQHYIESAFDAI